MKRTAIIIILLTNLILVFGQKADTQNMQSVDTANTNRKVRFIRVFQGEKIVSVREYDTIGNLVFNYKSDESFGNWTGKGITKEYITTIAAKIYDKQNKVLKSFFLHSNAGLSIDFYDYDDMGNNTKIFQINNDYEKNKFAINTNPYKYISEILNLNTLLNHPKIKEIERVAKKHLREENTYDSHKNVLTTRFFNEKGDTTDFELNQYDKNNNKIYFYKRWSKNTFWEYYYEYEKDPIRFAEDVVTDIKPEKTKEKKNLLQSVRIQFDANEQRKRITDITFYKYDKGDRVIEEMTYKQGEFIGKVIYEYNDHNKLIRRLTYNYDYSNAAVEQKYFYDNNGNIIDKQEHDFRLDEKSAVKYRYEYEYY